MRKIGLHWWIILGMVLGAALGATLHALHAPGRAELDRVSSGVRVDAGGIVDPADREALARDLERAFGVEPGSIDANQVTTLGRARTLVRNAVVARSGIYRAVDALAELFLKLLKLVVVPLVFFSLTAGMIGLGSVSRLGRLGARTFGLYVITSLLAILLGLGLVNAIRPGSGVAIAIPTRGATLEPPGSAWDVLLDMVPSNVVDAAARFDLIEVIVFTLLFGAFLLAVPADRRAPLVGVIEGGAEVMLRMTQFVIALAPVGIGAMIARLVATTGLGVFVEMKWYILTVLLALVGHALVTLPLIVYLATGRNPYRYLRAISPALLTGFSTASSSGTLGVTIECVEGAGVSNRVASFVLPLGATVNMDGTALYEIVTVLFIAQLHAAVDPAFALTFGQQVLIVFLGLAVSIGAAGIPHAGLVMMVIILQAVGLPVEYTGIIWAVDRLLDMTRTAVNLTSDSCIALIVAHQEGEVTEPA